MTEFMLIAEDYFSRLLIVFGFLALIYGIGKIILEKQKGRN